MYEPSGTKPIPRGAFGRLLRERGLPLAIRSDNGVPFASPNALFNLSKLSVWWQLRHRQFALQV